MLRTLHQPFPQVEFPVVVAVCLLAAASGLLLSGYLFRVCLKCVQVAGRRCICATGMGLTVALNWWVTGWWGVAVMSVAASIGVGCIVYGARRMNCLGCILVPVGIALSGWSGIFIGGL